MGSCDLCGTAAQELGQAVVVRHDRGGTVQFGACFRCAAAVRRLAAAFGGQARYIADIPAEVTVVEPARAVAAPAYPAELIQELSTFVRDPGGVDYVARVWGQARSDGTWTGWLEFTALASGERRRTDTETTQSNRE